MSGPSPQEWQDLLRILEQGPERPSESYFEEIVEALENIAQELKEIRQTLQEKNK